MVGRQHPWQIHVLLTWHWAAKVVRNILSPTVISYLFIFVWVTDTLIPVGSEVQPSAQCSTDGSNFSHSSRCSPAAILTQEASPQAHLQRAALQPWPLCHQEATGPISRALLPVLLSVFWWTTIWCRLEWTWWRIWLEWLWVPREGMWCWVTSMALLGLSMMGRLFLKRYHGG